MPTWALTLPWRWIGGGLIALAIVAAIWSHFAGDARTRDKLEERTAERDKLVQQSSTVLVAIRHASENPGLSWENAAGQVVALGEDHKQLKKSVDQQNQRIDDMAREAVRLKAEADEWQRIADRAEAQRRSALRRLSDMEITPGTRDDCLQLLREAEEALDLAREAGL